MAVLGTDLVMIERGGTLHKATAADLPGLKADQAATLSAAFVSSIDDDGVQSSGTYTPSLSSGSQYKRITNGGTFALAPPTLATDTQASIVIAVTNNASAGVISTSGFDRVTGVGFTSIDGDNFICRIDIMNVGGTVYSFLDVAAFGNFEMTAHYDDDIDFTFMTGWNSKKTPYSGQTPKGSVSGDLSADGGTVVSLTTDGFAAVVVEGPNSSLTNINIDGTDYALTLAVYFGGQASYTFTYGGFTDGQTYQVVLS